MKKSEFLKVAREYQIERRHLRNIKPGDIVWEAGVGDGWDICPIVVTSVNIDESYIKAIEISGENDMKGYDSPKVMEKQYNYPGGFETKEDMLEEGFTRKQLEEERRMYKGTTKKVLERKL